MSYIVLDLEWNYAKSRKFMARDPFLLRGEIIQIGAVKLNEELGITDSFNRIVKPDIYPRIHKKVQELTLITDEDLAGGVPFREAIDDFRAWCDPEDIILTWGPDDIPMLLDNLDFREMDSDWIPEDFDAQWMFDDQVTQGDRQYSLDYARYKFGIKGRNAHDALNDAYNTAEVIQHLQVAQWIEEERNYGE